MQPSKITMEEQIYQLRTLQKRVTSFVFIVHYQCVIIYHTKETAGLKYGNSERSFVYSHVRTVTDC